MNKKLHNFYKKDFFDVFFCYKNGDELPSLSRIYFQQQCITQASNRVEETGCSSHHSEILAIQSAQQKLATRDLRNYTLVTSLEPCLMCIGAIIQAKLGEVIYFAENTKGGGLTALNTETIYAKNHFPHFYYLPSEQVTNRWQQFFHKKRC